MDMASGDEQDLATQPTARAVKPDVGGAICDPADPMGELSFTVSATVAEFEADLARSRRPTPGRPDHTLRTCPPSQSWKVSKPGKWSRSLARSAW
ncbi:hypothetical protein GCM10017600_59190 [Streptosporangium carneum]|uniref:Resolvase/invertase-type recombinase catalytic domain-containing protein n=1 Tax=Streptosporangium carneum TaxID=47481 RepID=A0A9W6I7B0_9ACTN|nr:hypothetical protein GCM10017600_59190 [Streptosporangium carneum]